MGCNTTESICCVKSKEPKTTSLRRIKTMTYSSISKDYNIKPLDEKANACNGTITVEVKNSKKAEDEVQVENAKYIGIADEYPENIKFNKVSNKEIVLGESMIDIEIPGEYDKLENDQNVEVDPREKLIKLGYELEPDNNEEQKKGHSVKQLVIPYGEIADKLLKQSTGDEEPIKNRSSL